jgi:hypothetical protein
MGSPRPRHPSVARARALGARYVRLHRDRQLAWDGARGAGKLDGGRRLAAYLEASDRAKAAWDAFQDSLRLVEKAGLAGEARALWTRVRADADAATGREVRSAMIGFDQAPGWAFVWAGSRLGASR